jgi:hypothetical protein
MRHILTSFLTFHRTANFTLLAAVSAFAARVKAAEGTCQTMLSRLSNRRDGNFGGDR